MWIWSDKICQHSQYSTDTASCTVARYQKLQRVLQMPKLPFNIISVSGEDPDYPAEDLNESSPESKGWQSARFCEYPQELVLEFLTGVRIQQLQLLSHQSKITSKIEILMGSGDELSRAEFQHLGHLSMDDNQRSGHRAQELKSVFIDASGKWLKLKFHKCYINKYNLYNQIGIVAINVLGDELNNGQDGFNGTMNDDPFGAATNNNPAHKMSEKLNDLAFDLAFDRATADKIRSINSAKADCVAREDFQAAKALKNVENQMKAIGVQLAKMESQKQTAVAREDYDAARTLRDEIKRLRDGVDNRLAAIPAYKEFVGAYNELDESGGGGGGGGGGGQGNFDKNSVSGELGAGRAGQLVGGGGANEFL